MGVVGRVVMCQELIGEDVSAPVWLKLARNSEVMSETCKEWNSMVLKNLIHKELRCHWGVAETPERATDPGMKM